jgi:hypothetical protein
MILVIHFSCYAYEQWQEIPAENSTRSLSRVAPVDNVTTKLLLIRKLEHSIVSSKISNRSKSASFSKPKEISEEWLSYVPHGCRYGLVSTTEEGNFRGLMTYGKGMYSLVFTVGLGGSFSCCETRFWLNWADSFPYRGNTMTARLLTR